MSSNEFLKKSFEEVIELSKSIGSKRYHRLTSDDLKDYRKYDGWRYVHGDPELGTTLESKQWVQNNSDFHCPICGKKYTMNNGRSIDHKLPRSKYPWLSMDFRNLWVICYACNRKKLDMDWYEYELYMMTNYSEYYEDIVFHRPRLLLQELKNNNNPRETRT